MFRLDDKVAVITGGAKGIGKAVVEIMSTQGAHVHFLDIDEENGQVLAASNPRIYFHNCDVTDHEKVKSTFQAIYEQHQSLDILINNAGISHIGNVEQTSPEDMDRLYEVNIKSVYSCLHHAIPLMKLSKGGSIVNLSSIASTMGLADRFPYSMSKGAVHTMTYSIARDYINDGIRCNSVGPARVHTPFVDNYLRQYYPDNQEEMFNKLSKTQPIGRMAKPVEVAQLITYLCSEAAAFITGSHFPIDGGFVTLNT